MRYVKTVIVPQQPRLYNGSGDGWEMLVRGEVWAIPVSNTHQYFSRYQPKGVKNIAVAPDVRRGGIRQAGRAIERRASS